MRAQKTNKSGHEYECNHTIENTTATLPMLAPEVNLPEDPLNGDKLACRFGHASKEICWHFEVGTKRQCSTKQFWLR